MSKYRLNISRSLSHQQQQPFTVMTDTNFPQQESIPEDQQNPNPDNEKQQVALPEEVQLTSDEDPVYVGEIEDLLTDNALLEYRLDELANQFLIMADEAYEVYRQDGDWMEMAIKLWNAMRAYFAEEYAADDASMSCKSQLVKKYNRYQRNASGLIAFFLLDALRLMEDEPDKTVVAHITELLGQVRDEYEVINSASLGKSTMGSMYGLSIYMLEKGLQYHKQGASAKADFGDAPELSVGNARAKISLEDFCLDKIRRMDPAELTKFLSLAQGKREYYDLTREWLSEFNATYGKENSDISAPVSRAKHRYRCMSHSGSEN